MTPNETQQPPEAAAPVDASAPAEPALPPAPPPKRSPLGLLLGVIAWPRSTFTYLRDHGGATWLIPLIVAVGLTIAVRAVAVPIEQARAEAALAALQDQFNAITQGGGGGGGVFIAGPGGPMRGVSETGLPARSPVADYGLPALSVLGDWVLRGGALLGLAWILGGRPSAGAMFRMSGWTLLPDIARMVVTLAVMLGTNTIPMRGLAGIDMMGGGPVVSQVSGTTDDGTTTSSEGGDVITFAPAGGGPMQGVTAPPSLGGMFTGMLRNAFLTAVDIYTVWALVLLAIGVAVTAKLHWIKATLSSLLYFGLSVVLAALPPLLSFWLLRFTGGGPVMVR